MIKEEFIDKTAVANKTIHSLEIMIEKIKQTKNEGVEVYIEINKKFDFSQRVKVFSNEGGEKTHIGYGYVNSIIVEEDYGTIFYEIKKEDKKTKEELDEYFHLNKYGAYIDDYEYCNLLLEKAI